jgi:hypothetical protein
MIRMTRRGTRVETLPPVSPSIQRGMLGVISITPLTDTGQNVTRGLDVRSGLHKISDIWRLFQSYVFQKSMLHWAGLAGGFNWGAIAMIDLILLLSIFAAGVCFGYYLRDRISRKRRELYLESKRSRRSHHGSPTMGRFLHH